MSSILSRLWFGGLVLSLHSATLCYAQAPLARSAGDKYALADLVGLALQHTRLLGAQDARIDENRLAASQARIWPGSSLDLAVGRRSEAAVSGPRYELSWVQPLPLLGKLGLRGGLLELEAQSWQVRGAATRLAVTLDVVQLAYEYAVSRRKAGFIEKRQKRFELIREYLAGRVFPTPQRRAESRIVSIRALGLVSEAIGSQAGFQASIERLRVYVPLGPRGYPEIDVPWFWGEKPIAGQEWLAQALENNPDLRVQRLAVRGAELEKTLAARDGLPDPSLAVSYEESGGVETERNFGLGLSLALPSWNRNRDGIKSAEAGRLAGERLLGFEEQKLRAELPRLILECEAARRVVQGYPQDLLSELEVQLQEAEEGFRKGQVDLLTFLELDGAASEIFDRVLDAQREYAGRIAGLLAAAGEPDALARFGSF